MTRVVNKMSKLVPHRYRSLCNQEHVVLTVFSCKAVLVVLQKKLSVPCSEYCPKYLRNNVVRSFDISSLKNHYPANSDLFGCHFRFSRDIHEGVAQFPRNEAVNVKYKKTTLKHPSLETCGGSAL